MSFSVVIPNKFEDVIKPLIRSILEYETESLDILIVSDKHNRNYGFRNIRVDGRFNFSHSANVGIEAVKPKDVILLNDDVRLLQPTFYRMQEIAYSDPKIGILATLVNGGCGNLLMRADRPDLWPDPSVDMHFCNARTGDRVTFACVYIKRQLLDQIGLFDENLVDYGYDDADMSIRTVKAGWKLAITRKITVKHGIGGSKFIRGRNWNTSFYRCGRGSSKENLAYFMRKHSIVPRSSNL